MLLTSALAGVPGCLPRAGSTVSDEGVAAMTADRGGARYTSGGRASGKVGNRPRWWGVDGRLWALTTVEARGPAGGGSEAAAGGGRVAGSAGGLCRRWSMVLCAAGVSSSYAAGWRNAAVDAGSRQ